MARRPAKVGIAVVTYNASLAARVTLASLRRADNAVSSTLVLVDNASRTEDRSVVRAAVARHVAEAGLPWQHVQQETNLGFSGGNNVAIRMLLDDASVTHVCLLNSDVIVPHRWLDRLLASGQEIVSGVTNKAESEQCVPIDYTLALEDCLEGEADRFREDVFETVDDFADRWHRAWRGSVVDCDATFFCVLISRAAIERIGLLDERFFPGGYEDDDYCARARAAGLPVHLARDTYVHHWGSASFGELRRDYFQENAAKNRSYLEQKHGFTWRARPEKPFVAYAQDVAFAATGHGDRALQRRFHRLYGRTLQKLVAHYAREFRNLRGAVRARGLPMPAELDAAVAAATAHGDLPDEWDTLFDRASRGVFAAAASPVEARNLSADLAGFCAKVHDAATCNFAMCAFLETTAPESPPQLAARSWWRRSWSLLRHGVPLLLRLRGIVFFGGYPYAPRDHDGYFQRIRAIDAMFGDRWRIYFDPDPLPGQTTWYDLPAPRTLVLRATGGRLRRALAVLAVWLCALRCRTVYFHSVLRMEDLAWGRLFRWPWFRKVIDVHGVVPEEFRMHGDWYHAVRFERHEELAARRAHVVIVVTESMRRYLTQKYRDRLRGQVVVLPIFPAIDVHEADKPLADGRPVVVYAGGLQKWQQVPKMIEAIVATSRVCAHRFYCPDPDAVLAMLPRELLADDACDIVVERKTHEDLLESYRECHYGFLLREDSVVNHVACPTKLVEYLAMGIVPIVDCEAVGDFASLGMRVVRVADFTAGRLPDASERDAMARANFGVYGRLRGQREAGGAQLRGLLGPGPAAGSLSSRLLWRAAKLLPPSTLRGRVARAVWYGLRDRPAPAPVVSGDASPAEIGACDVLVQVGNFLAGGLENAVLDLNEAFRTAGLRVGMLVLGEQGSAAARARAQGVPICAAPYSDAAYRAWLRAASPKLVMSHYSVEGAAICAELGVPLVQVIHNIYLWLHGAELAAMRASAAHTSAFVAASSFALDYSVRRLGFPAEKCVVIPYGIDVRRFRELDVDGERRRLRAQLGIPPDAFVFLNVGAVNHQKNHLSQLRAFQACAAACPDARLVVVGPVYERELLNDCRNYLERNGLTDRVTFTGGVSDPHRYYAMADALVHTAFFEGGPLALLEALAANLPVVSVATGLAVHFVGRKGITLVPAHFDVAEYRGHINEMRSSPATEQALAAAMAKVYRERERPDLPAAVVDAFDKANAYRLYVDLVQGLIGDRTAARPALPRSWSDRLAETG